MNKNSSKKKKRFGRGRRDLTRNKWQIKVHWLLRFLIEAEKLEMGDTTKIPFKIINPRKMFGEDFVPYDIQIQAWVVMSHGQFLFLVSGTGSGKTLAIIPGIIEELLKKKDAHCLIMYPMKALAQDQEGRLRERWSELSLTIQRYDSSVSDEAKARIRENPGKILIITPDTLMGSLIATQNEGWYKHLTSPSMIWVDEFHVMSGTLGTALCYFIRILYSLHPALRVFFTSATLANVTEIAPLFPHSPEIIEGGSRHGTIKFHVGTIKDLDVVMELVLYDNGQFLIFIENKWLIEKLITNNDLLAHRVNRYHADLPDSERHLILSKFSKKQLKGLLCTSAVSLGIDIPSVKNIVLYGFPRSFSLLFQEMGRGTRNFESNGRVFLLLDDSKLIDSYYSTHLEELEMDIRSYRSDSMIIDLLNQKILRGMVLFAIKLGLNTQEKLIYNFKEAHSAGKIEQTLTWLFIKGFISKNKDLYVYFKEYADNYLHSFISTLRPGFPKYEFVLRGEDTVIGSINTENIPYRGCKGNYYTKGTNSYSIEEIDVSKREIYVVQSEERYVSKNLVSTVVSMIRELKFSKFENIKIRLADFKVRVRPRALRNYKILESLKEVPDAEIIPEKGVFELNFETRGLTLEFPPDQPLSLMVLYQLSKIILQNATVLINIDEREVDCYQNKEKKLLYFLDRSCPTGVSQQIYENLERILKKTYQILAACPCKKGCDKCSIPFKSSYLMPNFDSQDKFRKEEMIAVLRRVLRESGSIE